MAASPPMFVLADDGELFSDRVLLLPEKIPAFPENFLGNVFHRDNIIVEAVLFHKIPGLAGVGKSQSGDIGLDGQESRMESCPDKPVASANLGPELSRGLPVANLCGKTRLPDPAAHALESPQVSPGADIIKGEKQKLSMVLNPNPIQKRSQGLFKILEPLLREALFGKTADCQANKWAWRVCLLISPAAGGLKKAHVSQGNNSRALNAEAG